MHVYNIALSHFCSLDQDLSVLSKIMTSRDYCLGRARLCQTRTRPVQVQHCMKLIDKMCMQIIGTWKWIKKNHLPVCPSIIACVGHGRGANSLISEA